MHIFGGKVVIACLAPHKAMPAHTALRSVIGLNGCLWPWLSLGVMLQWISHLRAWPPCPEPLPSTQLTFVQGAGAGVKLGLGGDEKISLPAASKALG